MDDTMMGAYKEGKDLYATIAMGVYKNSYWDNMEKHEDGSPNPEGKKRRSNCKSLLLGIMYGRGAASIAEQIGSSVQEAQKIVDDFYTSFPKVKKWVDKTESDAKVNGYVEDFWGRRRRLPDIQLPKYDIHTKNDESSFNPLLGTEGIIKNESASTIEKYRKKLEECKYRTQINSVLSEAQKEGITIRDNGAFISRSERQCVNARVQGGAASMSKLAMRKVFDNKELRDLGFKIVLQIHDELIGECPKENAEKCAEILTSVMKESAKPVVTINFKCDADISPCWYYNDYVDELNSEFSKLKSSHSDEEALDMMIQEHSEWLPEQVKSVLI